MINLFYYILTRQYLVDIAKNKNKKQLWLAILLICILDHCLSDDQMRWICYFMRNHDICDLVQYSDIGLIINIYL